MVNWFVMYYFMNVYCNDTNDNINNSESVNFTVDASAPVVNLLSPADSVSYTLNSLLIGFSYNVSEANDVNNCSLIINGAVSVVNSSINKSASSLSISQTFVPGTYNWNMNCSDDIGNIGNSSVRSFVISAPAVPAPALDTGGSEGSGGGGGGASAIVVSEIIVNPSLMEVSSVVNVVKTREIEVYNNGNLDKSIRISVKELKDLIDISEEELNFNLGPGEKRKIKVRIVSPEKPGVYIGKILISGKEVLVSLEVSSKELLFDVSIVVPEELKILDIGDRLESQITLIPMGEEPRLDVTLNYEIRDFDGQTFLIESETLLVEGQKSFKKEFATQNLPKGDYVLSLELIYLNGVAVSSSHFKVQEKGLIMFDYRIVLLGLLVLFILFLIFIIFLIKRKHKKRKTEKRDRVKIR